jgi:membrane protein YdbS with pleckstrin-like domain
MAQAIALRTSRLAHLSNYLGVATLLVLLTLFRGEGLLVWALHLLIGLFILGLLVEPELKRGTRYIIAPNHLMEVRTGLWKSERKVIPLRSVGDVRLIQSVWGRLLKYGTLEISGMRADIRMEGVRNPERAYEAIRRGMELAKEAPKAEEKK